MTWTASVVHRLSLQAKENARRVVSTLAFLFVSILAATVLFTCREEHTMNQGHGKLASAVETVASTKVFFGHQSVGNNILRGIRQLSEQTGVDLEISELDARNHNGKTSTFGIAHARIGENLKPKTKIAEFTRLMRTGLGKEVDIALMKFCYVDLQEGLDAEAVYSSYIAEMEQLEQEFPSTTFVYVTMPLSSPMTGFKNSLKRILGRLSMVDSGLVENVKRHEFNTLLREGKGASGRLFDLAAEESTTPSGDMRESW